MMYIRFTLMSWLWVKLPPDLGFSPTATSVAQGSLAQITFGAIRCSFNARFRGRFRYRG